MPRWTCTEAGCGENSETLLGGEGPLYNAYELPAGLIRELPSRFAPVVFPPLPRERQSARDDAKRMPGRVCEDPRPVPMRLVIRLARTQFQ